MKRLVNEIKAQYRIYVPLSLLGVSSGVCSLAMVASSSSTSADYALSMAVVTFAIGFWPLFLSREASRDSLGALLSPFWAAFMFGMTFGVLLGLVVSALTTPDITMIAGASIFTVILGLMLFNPFSGSHTRSGQIVTRQKRPTPSPRQNTLGPAAWNSAHNTGETNMDPITSAIIGALANLGASMIKDAYEALKATIVRKFGRDSDLPKAVENLQQKPDSTGRQETLREEVAHAGADKDAEILKLAQALIEKLDDLALPSQPGTSIKQQAGNNSVLFGTVHGNVTINLSPAERRARAERKIDDGRRKVQEWGQSMSQSGWNEQAWHLLGFALVLTHEAVALDPDYQRAWTLMADVYHRIGKEKLAKMCLKQSYSLATEGPNFPGGFYKEVKNHIQTGYPFNRTGGLKRQSPPVWFEKKYQEYWTL